METKEITIKACLVFDVPLKKFGLKDYLQAADFRSGVYKTEYSHYVLVREVTLPFSIPAGFDIIKPQLNHLDDQEKELTIQYKQALQHIQVQRNNLLAIEHKPAAPDYDGNIL